jgi:hypothetical protein
MTDSLLRRAQHTLGPLQRREIEPALALCATDPVGHVVPAMHLEAAARSGHLPSGLWAVRHRAVLGRELSAVVWSGANLTLAAPPLPRPQRCRV